MRVLPSPLLPGVFMAQLSVVVPIHFATADYEQVFFDRCMRSLSEQSFNDFDLVCVINGIPDFERSIDGLKSRILEWKYMFKNPIRVLAFDRALGVSRAMNIGISSCDSPYIALQAQDDESVPERFAIQMDYLSSHPEVDVLGGGVNVGVSPPFKSCPGVMKTVDDMRSSLEHTNMLAAGSVIIKRSAVNHVGGFNEALTVKNPYEDWDLWKRMARSGAVIANVEDILYTWYRDFSTFDYYSQRGIDPVSKE